MLVGAIRGSMHSSTNKFVEKIFELDYPSEYLPYLYDCLTEENRDKFISLGHENPIMFIKFFSKFKRKSMFEYKS